MTDQIAQLNAALLDRYVIDRELGHGGMAMVYLARDLKHERFVALKTLRPEIAAALGPDRFLREIKLAARLQHPNILAVYDSGDADGVLYYVMPFVEGESLRDRLDREPQLPLDDAVSITREVADALAYAHGHDVVHRDIKPENIMLSGGHAIVADFGIARAVSAAGGDKLTATGLAIGTPAYMSPEQASGAGKMDHRSDIYSLACVLYETLAGQPPFTGPTAQAIMARHSLDSVPRLRIVREAIPDALEQVIKRGLAKVPADRYQTAHQFAEALTTASTGTVSRLEPERRRWAWGKMALLGAPVAAGLVLLGVVVFSRGAGSAASADSYRVNRVAMLYLEDQSRDGTLVYLADGLTEAVIEELDRVRALDVVSKNGVALYRGVAPNIDSVAAALRAGTLVRGTIEAVGDRLRVEFRLIDGNSGAVYSRGSVEEPLASAARAPRALAEKVALLLRERVGPEVALREERAGAANSEAWSFVQRAAKVRREGEALFRADSGAVGTQRLAHADSLLARAEGLDLNWPIPSIRRAAQALWEVRTTRDVTRMGQLFATGMQHVERALKIDPANAEALELRGFLRYYKRGLGLAPDPAEAADLLRGAEEDLKEATRVDDSRANAWYLLSHLLYQKFNRIDAKLAAQRAYEADAYLAAAPEVIWQLYATSYDLEQFDDAGRWCDVGQTRYPANPRFVQCRIWLQTSNSVPANVPEAWRLLGELEKRTPPRMWERQRREMEMVIAVAIARAGMIDSARRVIERARAGSDVDPRGDLVAAEVTVRALIGDKDEALDLLKQYLTAHPEHRAGYTRHRMWWYRSLQDDPRFTAIVGSGT